MGVGARLCLSSWYYGGCHWGVAALFLEANVNILVKQSMLTWRWQHHCLARPLTVSLSWLEEGCGQLRLIQPGVFIFMYTLLVSTGIVALAEIGDKTQLLAFVLAARFKRPLPIILGILLATLVNHGLAGALGSMLPWLFNPELLAWVLAISFLLMAVWILVPDKLDDCAIVASRYGVFATTFFAFFIAEMGDKTQIATIALAAQYDAFIAVVVGTTLGMMIANVPAVMMGQKLAHKLPVRLVHAIAACIFAVLGVLALLRALNLITWF